MVFAEIVKMPSLMNTTPWGQASLWAFMTNKIYFITGEMQARFDNEIVFDVKKGG